MMENDGSLLMAEFQQCNKEAFDNIVKIYKDKLYNFVLKTYIKNHDDAMDVVQNTFVNVFRNKYTYQNKYKFNAWIFKIAKNQALNFLRDKSRVVSIEEAMYNEPFEYPDDSIEQKELIKIINEEIKRLEAKYKEVLILRYFLGLPFKEIAEILNEKENTCKTYARRGLQKLNEVLKKKKIHTFKHKSEG